MFLLLAVSSVALAGSKVIPKEVRNFVAERNICDHFRAEPFEGASPEQVERRAFVIDSLDIYCSGTDARLAALKRRYKNSKAVLKLLDKYEERTE